MRGMPIRDMRRRLLCVLLVPATAGCIHISRDGRLQRWAAGRGAWSVVIPGVGQIMNGEYGKAALMLGLGLANNVKIGSLEEDAEGDRRWEWASEEVRVRHAVVTVGLGTWSGIDAYSVAKKQNETAPVRLAMGGSAAAGCPVRHERLEATTGGADSESAEGPTERPYRRAARSRPPVVLVLNPFGRQVSATLCCRF